MKLKSIIVALLIGLSLIGAACSKSAASMSDDDKYKLLFAATMSRDTALITEVSKKLGLVNADGTRSESSKKFQEGAVQWIQKNDAFIQEISTPEKAREYVKSHMPS